MEGYKSFREAVDSVKTEGRIWKYVGNGEERFSYSELAQTADYYDRTFEPDEWNYFVTFGTGEIGIFSCEDGDVEMLFIPAPAVKAAPKFCVCCGTKLEFGSKFCPGCGNKIG